MTGFLYYVPAALSSRDDMGKYGLGHAFERPPSVGYVNGGPDGATGTILFDDRRVLVERGKYVKDAQTWRKMPGCPAWCGHWNDDVPKPEALVRTTVIPGETVELGDGNLWIAPTARRIADLGDTYAAFCALPKCDELNDAGEWTKGGVIAKYRKLWECAEDFWPAYIHAIGGMTDGEATFEYARERDTCVTALATNYVVSAAECAALGLFNDETVYRILFALVDHAKLTEWCKKKALTASSPAPDG